MILTSPRPLLIMCYDWQIWLKKSVVFCWFSIVFCCIILLFFCWFSIAGCFFSFLLRDVSKNKYWKDLQLVLRSRIVDKCCKKCWKKMAKRQHLTLCRQLFSSKPLHVHSMPFNCFLQSCTFDAIQFANRNILLAGNIE